MEVGQSASLLVTGQTRDILAGIRVCCVTPGNVAVPSPRVPTRMCLKQPWLPSSSWTKEALCLSGSVLL